MTDTAAAAGRRLGAALDRIAAALERPHRGGAGTTPDADPAVLARAEQDAARLAAANDALAEANRALLAGPEAGDGASAALEAEIEALRAARAAEISQLSEIVHELDRLLAAEGETGGGAA